MGLQPSSPADAWHRRERGSVEIQSGPFAFLTRWDISTGECVTEAGVSPLLSPLVQPSPSSSPLLSPLAVVSPIAPPPPLALVSLAQTHHRRCCAPIPTPIFYTLTPLLFLSLAISIIIFDTHHRCHSLSLSSPLSPLSLVLPSSLSTRCRLSDCNRHRHRHSLSSPSPKPTTVAAALPSQPQFSTPSPLFSSSLSQCPSSSSTPTTVATRCRCRLPSPPSSPPSPSSSPLLSPLAVVSP